MGFPISNFQMPIARARCVGASVRMHTRAAFSFYCLISIQFLVGCDSSSTKPADTGATELGVVRTAIDGPVTLTLHVAPTELAYTDRAKVVVEVTGDSSVTLEIVEYDREKPHLEHQYEYRLTRGERKSAPPTQDGIVARRFEYDVQFFAPGEFEFPGASVKIAAVDAISGESRELKTESVTVRAKDSSAKPLTPEELRKLTALPPVELKEGWGSRWWIATGLATLAAASMLLLRRRGPRVVVVPTIPPHEWARRELSLLRSDRLVERGLIQEFYYRVSGVVRGYIERRFAVSAPEMTTEEFLVAAAHDGRFGPEHTGELQQFLTACDLVKYARQIPSAAEADQVLSAAGGFVERTTAQEASAP